MKISDRVSTYFKQLPILSTPPFFGKINLNPPFWENFQNSWGSNYDAHTTDLLKSFKAS